MKNFKVKLKTFNKVRPKSLAERRITKVLKKRFSRIKKTANRISLNTKAKAALRKANRTGGIAANKLELVRKAYGSDSIGNKITAQDVAMSKGKLNKAFDKQAQAEMKQALSDQMNKSLKEGNFKKVRELQELQNPELRTKRIAAQNKSKFWEKQGGSVFKAGAAAAIGAPIVQSLQNDKERNEEQQQQLLDTIGTM